MLLNVVEEVEFVMCIEVGLFVEEKFFVMLFVEKMS